VKMVSLRSFLAVPLLVGLVTAKFQYVGVNEAGPEFGDKKFPGVLNKDYVWPNLSTIDIFLKNGMNTFRINFFMERLIPNKLNGTLDKRYQQDLNQFVNGVTKKNAYVIFCPHNYGRYYDKVINDVPGFRAWWKTAATPFKDNPRIIWDTNNEYHDMDQKLVVRLNQAAIDGIRSTGAKQIIQVEGNHWSGAWSWTTRRHKNSDATNAESMLALNDPLNKIQYQMHQYLDSDKSGTHKECVNANIGVEWIKPATEWLKKNRRQGYLGEFAGGDNPVCHEAVERMLKYMSQNTDVWKGWQWWSAGPWWGDYYASMEPPKGKGYVAYTKILKKYL